jgi:hypothetical protein
MQKAIGSFARSTVRIPEAVYADLIEIQVHEINKSEHKTRESSIFTRAIIEGTRILKKKMEKEQCRYLES